MAKKKASKAVVQSVTYGTPAAVVGGYVASIAAIKWGVPLEVAGSAIALLAAWTSSLIARLSPGGSQGEAD